MELQLVRMNVSLSKGRLLGGLRLAGNKVVPTCVCGGPSVVGVPPVSRRIYLRWFLPGRNGLQYVVWSIGGGVLHFVICQVASFIYRSDRVCFRNIFVIRAS